MYLDLSVRIRDEIHATNRRSVICSLVEELSLL
jgi:hypothetical protein